MPRNDHYKETYVASPAAISTAIFQGFSPAMCAAEDGKFPPEETITYSHQIHQTRMLIGEKRLIVQLGVPLAAKISMVGLTHSEAWAQTNQLTGHYAQDSSYYVLMDQADRIIFSLSKQKLRIFIKSTTGQIKNITHYAEVLHNLLDAHAKVYVYGGSTYIKDDSYNSTSSSGFYDHNSPMMMLLRFVAEELYKMSIKLNYNMPCESLPLNVTADRTYLVLSLLKSPLMRDVYKPWLIGEGNTNGVMNNLMSSTNIKRDLKKYLGRSNPEFMRIFFKNIRIDAVITEHIAHDTTGEARKNLLHSVLQHGMGHKHKLEQTDDYIKWAMNTSINIDRFGCTVWVHELFESLDYQHKFIDSITSGTDMLNKPENDVIQYLRQFTERKRWRLINDETKKHNHLYGDQASYVVRHNLDFLRDALNQLKKYESPESIPETMKIKWPEGFKEPDKWETLKEFHDKISASYREIAAEADNKPITYTEEWLKLDNIELDGYVIKLAHETKTLVYWGYTLNHCIATYADRAENQTQILFGVYKGEDLIWNCRFDAKRYSLQELRGYSNKTDEKSVAYEAAILKRMQELGFPIPKNDMMGKLADLQAALEAGGYNQGPNQAMNFNMQVPLQNIIQVQDE